MLPVFLPWGGEYFISYPTSTGWESASRRNTKANMMRTDFLSLKSTFRGILQGSGFNPDEALTLAGIFTETTFDGVFSHGINRFPRFIGDVKKGIVKPGVCPELIQGLGALEQWDGKRGSGILNALRGAERSMELARESGIGCVGLRNTNHWLRGGTYGWKVADEGFLFMGWTNTLPNMPPWGGKTAALGNNPLVIAIPRKGEHLVLDMAMSQYSYGKLEWHQKCGSDLPEIGGYDPENKLTKDPSLILKTNRILPAGLWKGSGLSMVLDLAAAALSGGNTTRQIGKLDDETDLSQVFISIDIKRHISESDLNSLISESIHFTTSTNPEAKYPGQNSLKKREFHMKNGVEIPDSLWAEIEALSAWKS
jgi:3-dehydro-L-gulonate 2-dehydrogenase